MSMYCPGDGQSWGMPIPGDRSHNMVRRSGSGKGKGLRSSAFATLNRAVLAPIPMASESTITAVAPRLFERVRTAYRRSAKKVGIDCIYDILAETLACRGRTRSDDGLDYS